MHGLSPYILLFMLEAIAGGIPDGRQPMFLRGTGLGTVSRCVLVPRRVPTAGQVLHICGRMTPKEKRQRERERLLHTDTGIEHARMAAYENGGKRG